MGWTVWYQLVRDRAPTPGELTALAAATEAANAQPWDAEAFRLAVRREPAADGVIVDGASKIAMDLDASEDGRRMVAAINAALDAVPGAALRLHDDLGIFGVEGGRCSLEGEVAEPPVDVEGDQLVAIHTMVPPVKALPATLEKALAAAARGDGGGATAKATVIAQAMTALDTLDREDPRQKTIVGFLDSIPAQRRAQIGLERYGTLGRIYWAREHLGVALDQIEDVGPLVPAFLDAWRAPKGLYHYGDMPWRQATRDRLARSPEVVQQMLDDVRRVELTDTDEDLPWRCAEHATSFLGRSQAPAAIAALIALLQRWRGRDVSWRMRLYLLAGALEALGGFPHPRAFATLVLELAGCGPTTRARNTALSGLVRLDPARAMPILRQACAHQAGMYSVVEALRLVDTDEARALIDDLRAYPLSGIRRSMAWHDERAGGPVPPEPPMPPHETLLAHPDVEVREEALRALIDRGDRSLYITLLHAEGLHRALQLRISDSSNGPGWHSWGERGLVPAEVLRRSIKEQLAWARGDGAVAIGPQIHLDAMEPVRRLGVAAAADAYADPRLTRTDEEIAALLAEEADNLRALGA